MNGSLRTLDYFVLRPLEEATIGRWGLVQR